MISATAWQTHRILSITMIKHRYRLVFRINEMCLKPFFLRIKIFLETSPSIKWSSWSFLFGLKAKCTKIYEGRSEYEWRKNSFWLIWFICSWLSSSFSFSSYQSSSLVPVQAKLNTVSMPLCRNKIERDQIKVLWNNIQRHARNIRM